MTSCGATSFPSVSTGEEGEKTDRITGERFVRASLDQMDANKVEGIIAFQREALSRFEKTNEMLSNCCSLSASRLEHAKRELSWYTQMMGDMKKDLDSIYRRLRIFKSKVVQLYPDAFLEGVEEGEPVEDSPDATQKQPTPHP